MSGCWRMSERQWEVSASLHQQGNTRGLSCDKSVVILVVRLEEWSVAVILATDWRRMTGVVLTLTSVRWRTFVVRVGETVSTLEGDTRARVILATASVTMETRVRTWTSVRRIHVEQENASIVMEDTNVSVSLDSHLTGNLVSTLMR